MIVNDRRVYEGVRSLGLEKANLCEDCEHWRLEEFSAVTKFASDGAANGVMVKRILNGAEV